MTSQLGDDRNLVAQAEKSFARGCQRICDTKGWGCLPRFEKTHILKLFISNLHIPQPFKMYSSTTLAAAMLASLAAASPLQSRQMPPNSCGTAPAPFKLEAVDTNGVSYPLAVTFAAEFGQTLRLTANPASPFTGTSLTEEHIAGDVPAAGYVLSVQHKTQTNPNGDAVQFNSTVPAAGSLVLMSNPTDGTPGLGKVCGDLINNPTYYTADLGDINGWSLCDGDAVDKELGWKLLYYKGTDASCQTVSLKAF